MHVHLPKEGFKSFRGFLMELFTITCGVLIALSLEGVHQSLHQRHLLQEARANILAEVRDNHTRLLGVAEKTPGKLANFKRLIALFKQERGHRGSVDLNRNQNLELSLNTASLYSTSWSTAHSMGAVSLMSYQEVKHYRSIYELQELVNTMQNQTMERWIQWQGPVVLLGQDFDFRRISTEDLARMEHSASEAYCYWLTLDSLTKELIKSYGEFLAAEPKSHS